MGGGGVRLYFDSIYRVLGDGDVQRALSSEIEDIRVCFLLDQNF